MRAVYYDREGLLVSTRGLSERGLREIRAQVDTPALLRDCEGFLQFVVDYLAREKVTIKPDESMNYGYWMVKFRVTKDDRIEVWEYNPEATDFVLGASLTLRYWHDQHAVCARFDGDFSPPRPDKLTAVSEGVMEGLPVQAVRYALREHMSGWLIVTDKYNGDIRSLAYHHTYHLTARRPDVAPYLALPVGFRIDLSNGNKAWFDSEVASQKEVGHV